MEKKSILQLSRELDELEVELGKAAEAYAKQAVECLNRRKELKARVAEAWAASAAPIKQG